MSTAKPLFPALAACALCLLMAPSTALAAADEAAKPFTKTIVIKVK